MGSVEILVVFAALLNVGDGQASETGQGEEAVSPPVLERTFVLDDVHGAVDRTGIGGRIDHMNYDPATQRLFIACVSNGSLEVIDLDVGKRVGTVKGLQRPQGVAVAGGFVHLTTGVDGKLHRFDTRTLAVLKSVPVGDDADNVRIGRDRKIWVSFGGNGPGGLSSFDPETLAPAKTLTLPRMPEGFQLHADGTSLFANMPAGKRSPEDGTVVGLKLPGGEPLWERKFSGRSGNFPMTIDSANDRIFVVSRRPARLICLSTRDGSILGEAACPLESDDLFFDTKTGRVAVIGGGTPPTLDNAGGDQASLDLFTIDATGHPARVSGTPLPPHSRTGALAVDRRRIYVGVPETAGRPAELREYRLPD